MKNKKDYAIVHYTCQSFYDDLCGKSPRIVAICILLPYYGQINTFSIPIIAEEKGIDLAAANSIKLDELESEMLKKYFEYLRSNSHIGKWLHWNMCDSNFGFQAIEHRYTVLTRRNPPVKISDDHKLNISWLLSCLYGENYAENPKLLNLLMMNEMSPRHFLSGADEAKAFTERKYLLMERSSHSKVGCFFAILEKTGNNELKTNCRKWRDVYGISVSGIVSYIKENVVLALICSLAGAVLIGILGNIIVKMMFPQCWLTKSPRS